jgi:hypothetical protein
MATYTNRTCCNCGIRKPQPQMYQREVYVETAKSQTGISGATMFGVFAGDKKSGNQFRSWLFNSGQRTYKRKKQVWMCGVCAGVEKPVKKVAAQATTAARPDTGSTVPRQEMSTGKKWFWAIIILALLGAIFGDHDKKKSTTKPAEVTQTSP